MNLLDNYDESDALYQSMGGNLQYTPWKTNMSPKNQWLEDVFPIEIVPF